MKIMNKISCAEYTSPEKIPHEPHYNKNFRKTIMKRLRLKNKTNRSKNPVDTANYKKQRDLIISLNRQAKSEYFN